MVEIIGLIVVVFISSAFVGFLAGLEWFQILVFLLGGPLIGLAISMACEPPAKFRLESRLGGFDKNSRKLTILGVKNRY